MMTGRVSLDPKNTYLYESGKGFNSSLGGETIEGGIGELAKRGRGS